MKVTPSKREKDLPIEDVVKAINKKMDDVLRVVDALNLGRTEVKRNGVYRTFNDGSVVLIASGDFKKGEFQLNVSNCFNDFKAKIEDICRT